MIKRYPLPQALRLLSYTATWVGAIVACIGLSGVQQASIIAATVGPATILLCAASILEGRRHG